MKPFRARNTVVIGAIGIAVVFALLFVAFNTAGLPVIGGGPQYTAQFRDAAGVKAEDTVQIAGVKVGKVSGVELNGDHVDVKFRIKGEFPLGDRTRASVRVRTLLGQKFLALEPDGPGELDPEQPIPLNRTITAFDVVPAFEGLGRTTQDINKEQLAEAFTVIADTFRDTPDEVGAAVDGLARFSETISSRDAQLAELLDNARGVTQVLADRNQEFTKLIRDGDLLFRAINERREIIGELLRDTREVSVQLQGLVQDNQGDLRPALERLQVVTDVLQVNENNLAAAVKQVGTFVRLFANTIGTGRWFDSFIINFEEFPIDAVLAELPSILQGGGGAPLPAVPQGAPAAPADLAGLLQVPSPVDAPPAVATAGGVR